MVRPGVCEIRLVSIYGEVLWRKRLDEEQYIANCTDNTGNIQRMSR